VEQCTLAVEDESSMEATREAWQQFKHEVAQRRA